MFRKDEQAREQWSEDNVALCEGRQRRIIADVWPSLAEVACLCILPAHSTVVKMTAM